MTLRKNDDEETWQWVKMTLRKNDTVKMTLGKNDTVKMTLGKNDTWKKWHLGKMTPSKNDTE